MAGRWWRMARVTCWFRTRRWAWRGPALPPGVRRAVYPNGYHLLMRDKNRQSVIHDVIAWMQAPGELLPSGADVAAGGSWAASLHHPGGGLTF